MNWWYIILILLLLGVIASNVWLAWQGTDIASKIKNKQYDDAKTQSTMLAIVSGISAGALLLIIILIIFIDFKTTKVVAGVGESAQLQAQRLMAAQKAFRDAYRADPN